MNYGRLLRQEYDHHRSSCHTKIPKDIAHNHALEDTNLGVLCLYRCRQSGHCDQHYHNRHGSKEAQYIIKYHITKTYVIVEEQLHGCLTSLLDEVELSVSCPDHLNPTQWELESIG
jgi:hypothetical protein